MCPACLALAAMIAAGAASTGALGVVLAKTIRSRTGLPQPILQPDIQERSQDDNHRNGRSESSLRS